MPADKKAPLCGPRAAAGHSLLALRPARTVVTWADGAEAHGRFLDHLALGLDPVALAPGAHGASVAFYPAAAHLTTACDALWGAERVQSKAAWAR